MKKYYFLGVGGISMSALAILSKAKGIDVSGYDAKRSENVKMLKRHGICVDTRFVREHIDGCDVVVFSSAIKSGNIVFDYAKSSHKEMFSRGEFLGMLSRDYENVIAVAGSHGKTTTTAMIYEILKSAGKNPTLHLGGLLVENGENFAIGSNKYFVTEACEYCDNFLCLNPTISVVTNIEKEHMDYFKNFKNQILSFEKFKKLSRYVVDNCEDYEVKNLSHDSDGKLKFSLYFQKIHIFDLKLQICEEINAQNCIFAYKVAKKMGISDNQIKEGLENFCGVKKRFEIVSAKDFPNVICDYAHHPTEIDKVFESARNIYKGKKIVSIFQPHTYSRTKNLLNEFVDVFSKTDYAIFYKTYSAREKETDGFNSYYLMKKCKKNGTNSFYFHSICEMILFLKKFFRGENFVLLFIGAGDLPELLKKVKFLSDGGK